MAPEMMNSEASGSVFLLCPHQHSRWSYSKLTCVYITPSLFLQQLPTARDGTDMYMFPLPWEERDLRGWLPGQSRVTASLKPLEEESWENVRWGYESRFEPEGKHFPVPTLSELSIEMTKNLHSYTSELSQAALRTGHQIICPIGLVTRLRILLQTGKERV
jgi:hypothetical protein